MATVTYEEWVALEGAEWRQILREYRELRDPQNWHPHANIFPLVPVPGLAESISENGLLESNTLYRGKLLDGRARVLDCSDQIDELVGRFEEFTGTPDEALAFVIAKNLHRRHLGPVTWGQMFQRLAEVRRVPLGRKGGRPKKGENPVTVAELSEELGVPHRTAMRRVRLAHDLAAHPDLAEKVDSGDMPVKTALRLTRSRKAERLPKRVPTPTPDGIDLRTGDFREVLAHVPDGSVDLVLTDPPYEKAAIPLWGALGELGARVLRPGGLLVAFGGQYHLPAFLINLGAHLTYIWVDALPTKGGHNEVYERRVHNRWKPILVFAKGDYQPGAWRPDLLTDDGAEKDAHHLQQSVASALHYIDLFTEPGDMIVDTFVGTGTVLVAAQQLGRRAVGAEIIPERAQEARGRLVLAGVAEASPPTLKLAS